MALNQRVQFESLCAHQQNQRFTSLLTAQKRVLGTPKVPQTRRLRLSHSAHHRMLDLDTCAKHATIHCLR